MRTTTLTRTLADCLLDLPGRDAFVVGDSLLRAGSQADRFSPEKFTTRIITLVEETRTILTQAAGHRGVRRARRMLDLLSAWSESPGESGMRYLLLRSGSPPPSLQVPVRVGSRQVFLDAGWTELGIGLEFDGGGKYGITGEALYQEKLRQERIETLGWRVIRASWQDLRDPEHLLSRVLCAVPTGAELSVTPRPWMR